MFKRSHPPTDPVTVFLDGDPIVAQRGEPVARALIAADKTILARSPKLHRPRGPSCFRGGCDGCLARVDGVPNVMTCLTPAREGTRIDSQNVVGSRKADLLRVTDWFFPKGIDHHHLMAGVPGLSGIMQGVAQKVAGLGRLPSQVTPARPATTRDAEVLIVGAGVTGIAAAATLAENGKGVLLVDDGLAIGGSLTNAPETLAKILTLFPLTGVEIRARSTVAGVYDGRVLVVRDGGEAMLVRPRAMLFATGAHDGLAAFPGNDLPGVFSARALAGVLRGGVRPDGPVATIGEGFWADELDRALAEKDLPPALRASLDELEDVRGTGGVRSVALRRDGVLHAHPVAVVALALPGAPAFEVAAQAGADTRFDARSGYIVVTEPSEPESMPIWAVGECTGATFDPDALAEAGAAVGEAIARALS